MVFGKNWGLGFVYPQTLGAKEFPSIAFFYFHTRLLDKKESFCSTLAVKLGQIST